MTSSGPAPSDAAIVVDVDRALFVYCVLAAADLDAASSRISAELTGLDGGPVEFVRDEDLAAAVTVIDLERPPGRRADLLAYQSVLDVLVEAGPVAPVRFGSVLADADMVVEEFLLPQREQFIDVLERLRGRRQFNLRASYVEEAVLGELVSTEPEIRALRELTRDAPEVAFYRERVRLGELVARALEDRSSYDADMLLDAVVPLTEAHLIRTAPSATQVLDVALLVEQSRGEELVSALEDLAEAVHERIRLRLLGPLAPYDFVGEESWA